MIHRLTVLLAILLSTSISAFPQQTQKEENDSLVRLLTASRAQLVEDGGRNYRRVEGDVMFLHNNTYLYCDTALWYVEGDYIDALGHVQIVQDNAILSSDKLHYDIAQSLATFRGTRVQLEDRDSNILRTHDLDYNTRDSIAYFRGGGSMRDKDGNIIESRRGRFESKLNLFTFVDDVEMFSDSAFFSCDSLWYETKLDKATFRNNTKGWYGRNHIRSGGGWYDKAVEKVFFDTGVYMQTEEYEAWCEELLYDRPTQNVRMYRNVQILDTVHNVMAAGGFLDYRHAPRRVLLTDNPSLIGMQQSSGADQVDTLFLRADTLIYESLCKYQVMAEAQAAEERLKALETDAVANKRANDAADAAAEDAQANKNKRLGPGGPGGPKGGPVKPEGGSEQSEDMTVPPADGLEEVQDSLMSDMDDSSPERMAAICDSLSVADSLFVFDDEFRPDSAMIAAMDSVVKNWKDSTLVTFLHGCHNVRMYRSNMQMVCDSLEYSDLDSIARLYLSPVVWKDIKTQLSADSIQFVIRNETVERGIMLSNAMIIAEQVAGKYYHQIKSPEMTGFFAKDGSELKRFDAIGGVQALFFMEEDSVVTMMNQKEAKILTASFRRGNVERVLYMDGVKSDVYPVWFLWKKEQERMKLKGFDWQEKKRPADRYAITSQQIRASVRNEILEEKQFPLFVFTTEYFPGYIEEILKQIDEREPMVWKTKDKDTQIVKLH